MEKDLPISLSIDGKKVVATLDETIWQVASRVGIDIPHLCYKYRSGYESAGNCRACVVEVEGERTLAASCQRRVSENMKVNTKSEAAIRARQTVFELLNARQQEPHQAHDQQSVFNQWLSQMDISRQRFGSVSSHKVSDEDKSHSAIAVNMDACIQCTLCVRACQEVQENGVIGLAGRAAQSHIVFDQDRAMEDSTCVACGECVEVCPTGALMPANLVDAQTKIGRRGADEIVRTVCPFCGVGCQIDIHVRDKRIAYVQGADGPANQHRLCVKGRFGLDYVHHPERLRNPLIRKKGAQKTLDMNPADPLSHFREASWEEAIEVAAKGFLKLAHDNGGEAIAGFGSAKGSNEEAYLFQKLIRTAFGHNNVDHCTRLCHASSVAALLEGIGSGAVTASFRQSEYAEVIIVIGSNPTENHPVAATYFKRAARRGANLIVMDPRAQALANHATHMLQMRPGSDVSLINSLMNVIIEEKLYKEDFIEKRSEGFEELRQHLEAYTPERMALVTGIDPKTVREVARLYARSPRAIIFWGMGVSQHVHGTDNVRALISLSMMCGQVGREGTGLHPLRGQNNVQGASDAGLIPMFYPDYRHVSSEEVHRQMTKAWKTDLSLKPGKTVVEIIDSIYEQQIRGLYVMGENPAMSDPDLHHARAALKKLNHLVVQDIFLTETAMLADVVLPASAWPEKSGTVTNTNRQVQMGRPAVDPPANARQDVWILNALGQALGLDWRYNSAKQVFEEMKTVMPSLDNITWQRLLNENAVAYPCEAPDQPGADVVFSDRFPTVSGKAKLVPATVIPPDELPDKDFPMVLTTGRQLEHWHTGTMTRRAKVLDHVEPGPVVCVHPETLSNMRLQAGDLVKVSTRRGAVELTVRADTRMQRDMLFVPFAYVEAAANILTNPKLDPFGKIPEFKYCAAKLELANGYNGSVQVTK